MYFSRVEPSTTFTKVAFLSVSFWHNSEGGFVALRQTRMNLGQDTMTRPNQKQAEGLTIVLPELGVVG